MNFLNVGWKANRDMGGIMTFFEGLMSYSIRGDTFKIKSSKLSFRSTRSSYCGSTRSPEDIGYRNQYTKKTKFGIEPHSFGQMVHRTSF
jgi:hypothetical protein